MVTKGCMMNKGLASVKFCDSFSPQLGITAVWKLLASGYMVYKCGYVCMLIAIQTCRVMMKSNAWCLYNNLMVILSGL